MLNVFKMLTLRKEEQKMSGVKEIKVWKKGWKIADRIREITEMPGKDWSSLAVDLGCEVLGSLILAVTTYNVALFAELPMVFAEYSWYIYGIFILKDFNNTFSRIFLIPRFNLF